MPIYAYKCASCGHADDVLQKLADAPLTVCPKCGQASYSKQITAPQFQLKGSGWYVTDFRGGSSGAAKSEEKPKESGSDKPAEKAAGDSQPAASSDASTPGAKPAESKPATTPAATGK